MFRRGWLGGHPIIDAAFLKSENGAENLDDLCGFGDQGRALLDQAVRSFGPRVEGMTWDGKYLAAETVGVAGGNEGASTITTP